MSGPSRTLGKTVVPLLVFGAALSGSRASGADGAAARGECEAHLAAGRRQEAIAACERAVAERANPLNLRTGVLALLSSPPAPTAADVIKANLFAAAARRTGPTEPWGYVAQCDIAQLWGEPGTLDACLQALKAAAPDHAETRRLEAALGAPFSAGMALGWIALGVCCVGTLGHALRAGRRRRRGSVTAGAVGMTVAIVVALTARLAFAAPPAPVERFPVDDANPESSVPTLDQANAAPLDFGYHLQMLIEKGALATQRGDHTAAIPYYRALTKAVPDRATAFSKLCASYEAAGQREKAIEACNEARVRPGVVVEDFARYVRLLMAKSGPLTTQEVQEIAGVAKHLQQDKEGGLSANVAGFHLQCELGLRFENVPFLEECTAGLAKVALGDPRTISFQWALALKKGKRGDAQRFIEAAKVAGMKPEGIEQMQRAMAVLSPDWPRRLLQPRVLVPVLLMLALAATLLAVRRRRPPRQSAT